MRDGENIGLSSPVRCAAVLLSVGVSALLIGMAVMGVLVSFMLFSHQSRQVMVIR
jgi:hypothetical protein